MSPQQDSPCSHIPIASASSSRHPLALCTTVHVIGMEMKFHIKSSRPWLKPSVAHNEQSKLISTAIEVAELPSNGFIWAISSWLWMHITVCVARAYGKTFPSINTKSDTLLVLSQCWCSWMNQPVHCTPPFLVPLAKSSCAFSTSISILTALSSVYLLLSSVMS